MIRNKNFSGVDPTALPNETQFELCNFAKLAPGTPAPNPTGVRLWPGDNTPRTFVRCNLTNCEPPPGSTLINCNTALVEDGVVTETDIIVVDGVEVARTDQTVVRHYGRYNPDTESYDYLGTPYDEPNRK